MSFSQRVKSKKQAERDIYLESSEKVMESAVGRKSILLADFKPAAKNATNALQDVIDKVTAYYKIPHINITREDAKDETSLDTTLGRTGLTRRKVVLKEGKWWIFGEGPLIASTVDGDLVTLIPKKFGGYQYEDPKVLNRIININKETAKNIQKTVYCFYKPFKNDKAMTIKDLVKYVFASLSKFDIAFLALISIITTVMGMILPQVNKLIFDVVVPSGTMRDIFPMAALLIGVTWASSAFALFQSLWISRIGDKVQFGTQGALWIRLLNLPMGFFKNFSSGDLATRTFRVNQVCNTISSTLLPAVLSAIFSFLYLFQISSLAPSLLLPTFCIIIINLAISLLNGYFSTKLNKRASEVEPKLSGLVYQLFNGILKIKVAASEVRAYSKWSKLYSKLSKISFSPNLFIKINSAITGAISLAGTMFIYYQVFSKGLRYADFVAFGIAYGAFSAAIMQISGIVIQIAYLKPSVELLEPILKEVPETNLARQKVNNISGKIDISHVKFRYKEDSPYIINDLSLSIKQGEYLGIVGTTGCGKSTLFRLLLGFEKPESGAVFFDNQDLDKLDVRSIRKKIGIVLQNGNLFADSIFSNITITNPLASMDEAWVAAERAGVAEDIKKMPMGMHTMITEDGGGISGGQKQRIMIARALISSPSLLMFDEATSALDNTTQNKVVQSLEEMSITRIVIAHRLSTIKRCHRIVYLDKGKIVEQGTYEELMALNGHFAELAKRQIV